MVGVGVGPVARRHAAHGLGLAGLHRAALQPLLAARGPDAEGAHRGAARALRLHVQGRIRRRQLAPLDPRQCLLHRHRPPQAHRVLRHAARESCARRGGGGAGARARAFPAEARAGAAAGISGGGVRRPRRARLAGPPARLLSRARRADASTHAALLLFVLVVPAFTLFLTPLTSLWSRRHEFAADAFASRYASARSSRARWSSCIATMPAP